MEAKNADLSALKINRSGESSGGGSSKKYIIILIIVAAVLAGIYLLKDVFIDNSLPVSTVTVSRYTPSQSSSVLNASGYVVAQRKAAVASKGTGRLVYLGVVEGDKVTKDQIIARLEDSDVLAALATAKANLQLAEADQKDAENRFNRIKEMLKSGASSQQDYEIAEANLNRVLAGIAIAKAQVRAAEVNVENTLIRAPFNGTVLTKNADVGEIVAPFAASASSKAAVVTIADMTSLEVETDVSESNIFKIKPGQSCEISLDAYSDIRYPGYVTKIVPTADRAKATVLVKVGFKAYDSKVLPEMSAKVAFLNPEAEVTAITSKTYKVLPVSAVRNKDGKQYVYTFPDGLVREVEVQTGEVLGGFVEILGGVTEDDKIINNLTDEIKSGLQVRTEQKK